MRITLYSQTGENEVLARPLEDLEVFFSGTGSVKRPQTPESFDVHTNHDNAR